MTNEEIEIVARAIEEALRSQGDSVYVGEKTRIGRKFNGSL